MKPSRSLRTVRVIVTRDLKEFSRDRLWMVLTPLSLVMVAALFMVLPDEMGRSLELGVYPSRLAVHIVPPAGNGFGNGRMTITGFDSEAELEAAVTGTNGNLDAGLVFPADFPSGIQEGGLRVTMLLSGSVPPFLEGTLSSGIREAGYALEAMLSGRDPIEQLPVRLPDTLSMMVTGDRGLHGLRVRQMLRPLLMVLILLIESLALAGLVSVEIQKRTASAILVTPARTGDVLAAKCILGVVLAAVQATLFLLATGVFHADWPLLVPLIILGSLMASSVGMLTGAGGRDFMGTMFFGLLFLIPLMIPALYTLMPGRAPLIVRMIPSYGLVQSFRSVLDGDPGLGGILPWLTSTVLWTAGMLTAAFTVLRKSMESV